MGGWSVDPTPALIQGSAVLGIIGLTLTWYGGMSKYAGFYDTALAWRQVFWGILIGGVAAWLLDLGSFQPQYRILTGGTTEDVRFNLFEYVLVIAVITAVFHFMLRRESVRTSRAEPTSGWALGAAVGSMISFRFIVRRFEVHDTFELDAHGLILIASVLLAAVLIPRSEAILGAWHGYGIQEGSGVRAFLRASLLRATLHLTLPWAILLPLYGWVFLVPFVLLGSRAATRTWLWAAVPKEARRRLRRIWADAARSNRPSNTVITEEAE